MVTNYQACDYKIIEPVKIRVRVAVTDANEFINSCQQLYALGEEVGFLLLERYKAAIEPLPESAQAAQL